MKKKTLIIVIIIIALIIIGLILLNGHFNGQLSVIANGGTIARSAPTATTSVIG